MWAWKYVLKDEILDMLLAHKSLPCEDAKRIREKLSTQETWRKAMAGGLLFSRETLDNIPDNELDPSILTAIGDSSVAHDIVMIWTWRRGKSVKVVANKSWLGALQPASQEAAEFLADLIYTKKDDEKVKSVLHTNFDVNALLEREVLKPIWDKLTKKDDKTAAATQAESADEGALDDAALVKAAIRLSEPNEAKATEAVHAVEALKTEDKEFLLETETTAKDLVNSLLQVAVADQEIDKLILALSKVEFLKTRSQEGSQLFIWDVEQAGEHKTDARRSPPPFQKEHFEKVVKGVLFARDMQSTLTFDDSDGPPPPDASDVLPSLLHKHRMRAPSMRCSS